MPLKSSPCDQRTNKPQVITAIESCFALLNQAFRKERRLTHPPHPGLQSSDGFTLIEMMLVVTILGILVSMV
jgi:prepilin-type N-terminal cleavage/methylation domain-containing protein